MTSLPSQSRFSPAFQARITLALLLAINLFNYIDRQVLASVEKNIQADLLATNARAEMLLGLLQTAFIIAYMLLAPVFGILADRVSRWLLIGVGVILWSLASGASGLAGAYTILLITRCFVGVGEAAYGPVAPTLLSDLFPVEKRGRVLAWFYLAIPLGSAIGYAFGGFITPLLGWRWAFYLVVPPGILLGLWALFMKDPPRGQADGDIPTRKAKPRDYLALLHNRSYMLNTLGMTAMTFAIGGISFWMPRYLSSYRGAASLAACSLTFGIISALAGITATLSGGYLADKLRPRYPGSYFSVSAIALLGSIPCIIGMMYAPFPLAWIFVFCAVFGIFFSTGPTNTILANVTRPSIRASAFAINILIIHALGDAVAPFVLGWIFSSTRSPGMTEGNMNLGFWLVNALILLGGILWWAGAKGLQRDTQAALTPEPA